MWRSGWNEYVYVAFDYGTVNWPSHDDGLREQGRSWQWDG